MVKGILMKLFKKEKKIENKTKYPIIMDTIGVISNSHRVSVDTLYGTRTIIYEDGTRKVIDRNKFL